MKLIVHTLAAATLAALPQLSKAQASSAELPPAHALQSFHPLKTGVVFGAESPQEICAASKGWKARFAREGTTFVPFLGSHQPRSLPLSLRLESVRAGELELASAAATLGRAGERVAIGRGQVEEIWQLGEAGIEQRFVVHERTAPGEIVVRIAFEGEYDATLDAEGVLFQGPLGAVRYGLAHAFDAAGAHAPVRQSLDGDAIVLSVPASFVAEAEFPLTIDPLVSSFGIQVTLSDTRVPDVSYEPIAGTWLYVFESVFSQTDHDVYSVLADDTGILPGTTQGIDTSLVSWARPRVASCRRGTSFLVVAEVGPPGSRHVYARMLDSHAGTSGPSFSPSSEFNAECRRPDVGGDPNDDSAALFCVVWEMSYGPQSSRIASRMVDPMSTEMSSMTLLDTDFSAIDTHPAIARSCGLGQDGEPHWTVVWQREASAQDHDIRGIQLARDGTTYTPPFTIESSPLDEIEPSVSPLLRGAGAQRPYAVAWATQVGPANHDIRVASMIGDQVRCTINLSADQPSAGADDRAPCVESDGHLFALTYTKVLSASDSNVWLNWVWAVGTNMGRLGNHELVAGTPNPEAAPALASKYSGGLLSSRRLAVTWEVEHGSQADILASIYDAPTQVPVESFCSANDACPCGSVGQPGGCSNSAQSNGSYLTHSGHPNVSDDTLVLTASGMPSTVPCLFLQGTSSLNGGAGFPFGDGLRCVGGSVVRLATKAASFGVASYPLPGDLSISERGSIPTIGGLRHYQVWYRDPASFCTSANFNLSSALSVRWLP